MVAVLNDASALILNPVTIAWSIVAALPMAAMGWVFGITFLWMILGPIAARIQGWPFKVGDEVFILSGKEINRVARIYEIWHERGQVRVDLGAEAKNSVEDVFCAVAVCRLKTQIKPAHTTAGSGPV